MERLDVERCKQAKFQIFFLSSTKQPSSQNCTTGSSLNYRATKHQLCPSHALSESRQAHCSGSTAAHKRHRPQSPTISSKLHLFHLSPVKCHMGKT